MNFKIEKNFFYLFYVAIASIIGSFLLYKVMQQHVAFNGYELFSNIAYDKDSNSNGKNSVWFILFSIIYIFYNIVLLFLLNKIRYFSLYLGFSGFLFIILSLNFNVEEYRKEALLEKYNSFVSINSGFELTANGKLMLNYANEINIDKFTEIYSRKLENIKVSPDVLAETLAKLSKVNDSNLTHTYELYIEDNYLTSELLVDKSTSFQIRTIQYLILLF